jgi:PmbA protein
MPFCDLSSAAQATLAEAKRAGADQADVMVLDASSLSIEARGGALEHAERSEGVQLGLRVLVGQRQACVAASDLSAQSIDFLAQRAVAMAAEAPEDPFVGLADPAQLSDLHDAAGLDLSDPSAPPSPEDLLRDACAAEAAALAVAGVSQVQGAGATYGHQRVYLVASNGFCGSYSRTSRSIGCTAITGEGTKMERDSCYESRIFQADLPSAGDIGTLAGERAAARAGARRPKTGAYPVVFDERVAVSLINHVLGAANGQMIARGSSWLRDKLGAQILPAGLSVVENPLRPRVPGSRPFDAEGLPSTPRNIVENGVLMGWTLDLATARQLGLSSTASASRGPSSAPSPSAGNITLTPGAQTRAQLLAEMGTGVLIDRLIGSTINPNTGDYSRGAAGYWVENGEIQYPINECTLAGNLLDMLQTLTPANDGRAHQSRVVPSLRVDGLTLAGA